MDWPQLAAFVQSAYPGPRVVELGGGAAPWIRPNVDTRPGETVDLVADFNAPLPIAPEQFDGVFSKYAAEHVSWRRVDAFFVECHRILKPGGVAVFVLPNTHEQCKLAVEKFDAARWDFNAGGGVSEMLFGGQDYAENAHATAFSPLSVCCQLRAAGFASVLVVPFGEFGTDMVVECKKGA